MAGASKAKAGKVYWTLDLPIKAHVIKPVETTADSYSSDSSISHQ